MIPDTSMLAFTFIRCYNFIASIGIAFPSAVGMHSPICAKGGNAMLIFHHNRRDLVAKALFDIFKLISVAACVSGFFQGFNTLTRVGIYVVMGLTGIFGILVCPTSNKES